MIPSAFSSSLTRRVALKTGLALLPVFPSLIRGQETALPQRGLCAHRGVMKSHPENTLPAFQEALRHGAAMIEFDVQMTVDGHLVIMHDATVDRTTDGKGAVKDLTLDEIRKLKTRSRFDPRLTEAQVPTFEETLAMMPPNVWLNCHIKGGAETGAAAAKEIVRQSRQKQAFLAAKLEASQGARAVVPDILICNMERQSNIVSYAEQTIEMKAEFIQFSGKGAINPEAIRLLKEAGVRINYFSANDPEIARALFEGGIEFPLVDQIDEFNALAKELDLVNPIAS